MYGFSVPRMLGVTGTADPDRRDDPAAGRARREGDQRRHVRRRQRPVVWRGPMLHRALQQFLADVFWGDLDVLLLDLPPGTGDIAISTAQLIPTAEILVVTTPQTAASEVAERAGAIVTQTRQRIAGVVENMSAMTLPDGTAARPVRSRRRGSGCRLAEPADRHHSAAAGPDPAGGRTARRPVTPGCPWCWPPAPARPPRRCAEVAGTLAARSRPLAGVSLGIAPARPLTRVRFRRDRTAAADPRWQPRPASALGAAGRGGRLPTLGAAACVEPVGRRSGGGATGLTCRQRHPWPPSRSRVTARGGAARADPRAVVSAPRDVGTRVARRPAIRSARGNR